ncbi:MAG: cytochrome c3 family protein [Actinobacteria bacterium]|nr:cytochrome c3 family protein [Actinomycetota bacterium]MBU1494388.1 cytochrome c3 family protein [Actinomycetota bacterium]
MTHRSRLSTIGALLAALSLVIAACSGDDAGTTTTAAPVTTTEAPATTTTVPVVVEPAVEIPFLAAWEASAHNAADAEAFRHWDGDDPAVVPESCAKCHVGTGFQDFVGADGSAAGVVDAAHDPDTTITCTTCHNAATLALDSVTMPSGVELTGLGAEARCMTCHQGRASKVTVDEAITAAGVGDDEVSEDLGFINIHYFAAAATKYGNEAMGGYQYEGGTYDAFFTHIEGYETCVDCHNPHSLELKIEECATCHVGVTSADDLKNVRMMGSLVDYDGDGDLAEGIYYEIEGATATLYLAMQAYASETVGTGLVYDGLTYPYFFADTDGDGAVTEGEANFGNAYPAWTPRLVRAAYNYQVALKDPGAFAHGGKYILQLLSDSTEDLNSVLSSPIAVDAAHRIDHGHFAGSEEAFRHWDEDDPAVVPASCSKCHSAAGLPLFLAEGVTVSQEPSNGFLCSTCHNDFTTWTRHEAGPVEFPSGLEVDSGSADGNLCMNCHQGRESTVSVNAAIGDAGPNDVVEGLRFRNVHYFPAGATLFGGEVQGGFQFAGKEYAGRNAHVEGFDTCTECHGSHTLEVKVESCAGCHGSDDPMAFRISEGDFDGDGDAAEGLYGEIDTLRADLYAALQAYSEAYGLGDLIYDPNRYPYFFSGDEAFGMWTPALLGSAYNYQYAVKDPGGFAHNGKYVIQLLIDSIENVGGDVTGYTRP